MEYKRAVTPIFFAGVGGCGKTTTAKLLADVLGAKLAPSRTRDSYASFKERFPGYADAINTERETQQSNDYGMAAIALQLHIMQEFEKYVCEQIIRANAEGELFVIFERTPWCHASYLRLTIDNAAVCKVQNFKDVELVRKAYTCYARIMRIFIERNCDHSYYAANRGSFKIPATQDDNCHIEDAIVVHLRTSDEALQRIAQFGDDNMRDTSIRKNAMMRQYLIRMLHDPLVAHNYCVKLIEYDAFSTTAGVLTTQIAGDIQHVYKDRE